MVYNESNALICSISRCIEDDIEGNVYFRLIGWNFRRLYAIYLNPMHGLNCLDGSYGSSARSASNYIYAMVSAILAMLYANLTLATINCLFSVYARYLLCDSGSCLIAFWAVTNSR